MNQTSSSASRSKPASLVFPRAQLPGELRLFCFPYAGSGAMVYRAWPDELPASIEVIALQYPGRESRLRSQPHTAIQPLVQELVEDMLEFLDRPYAFFGHSLGGLIAFETARELRRRGMVLPVHLFVSNRRAPQLPEPNPPISDLPAAEFALAVQERYNGIPKVIQDEPELLEIFLPTLKADFSVFENYQYTAEDPFDLPVTGFYGLNDPRISLGEISAWQDQSSQPLTIQSFPGDHFYLNGQRSALLQAVAKQLMRPMQP